MAANAPPPLPALADCVLRLATPSQLIDFNGAMQESFFADHPVTRPQLDKGLAELAASPTRTDGRCLTWALVARNDPDGTVFTFVDTLRRDVLVRSPGKTVASMPGGLYSIQSVCTPKKYRRHGYARLLLRTIHYLLAAPDALPPRSLDLAPLNDPAEGTLLPPALGSVLSSDLVPGWYEKCTMGSGDNEREGWVSVADHSNSDLYWPLSAESDLPLPGQPDWSHVWVYQHDLEDLAPLLSQSFRNRLASEPDDGITTLLLPDPGAPGWLTHLEVFSKIRVCKMGRGPTPADTPVGVRFFPTLSTSSPPPFQPSDPIVLFIPGLFSRLPDLFSVTMMSDLPPSLLPTVLRLLVPLARQQGNKEIRAWGLDPDGAMGKLWCALGGRIDSRYHNRTFPYGFAWYGPEGTKGDLLGCEMWGFT